MNYRRYLLLAASTLLLLPISAFACLWDRETLLEERSRFPTALEIILGKFPRHSEAYYSWRLDDRREKLKSDPNNDFWLDDVAVSLERLKRYEEAIEVATKQLERNPNRYESLANLGTFYVHAGQLEEGLKYIDRAIEVNPDAHFGREKYQAIVVKYVMKHTTESGLQLPLGRERLPELHREHYESSNLPFLRFLRDQLTADDPEQQISKDYLADATKGVLGMMRFSRYDSPILLEVLGELQQAQSAEQLAFRAYTSAAENVLDEDAKRAYKRLASRAIEWPLQSFRTVSDAEITEEQIAADFRQEKEDANAWFQRLASDEKKWIELGEAVDSKFITKYGSIPEAIVTDPPELTPEPYDYLGSVAKTFRFFVVVIAVLVIAVCAVIGVTIKRVVA